MKKLLIAGTNSGVGKTTISLGIMAALKNRGLKVQPYKVGPDYIDPSYHSFITGQKSRNLDSYMLEDEKVKYVFNEALKESDVAVVEGVMGLYDGKGTDIDCCSSSYTSKLLNLPVILVINAKAMAASSAAMVLGYQQIDPKVKICGVIANNVKTESHFKIIKQSIEKYCGIEVLGYFPPNSQFNLPSRHLGLIPTAEMTQLEAQFENLGTEIEKYIDIDRLLALSESEIIPSQFKLDLQAQAQGQKIGIAYDEAFNFYYPDNLELLERLGLELVYFSPLKDEVLPDCGWYYIGGGFPEVFAKALEANKAMREALRKAHEQGKPIYAECGGLMYLGEKLIDHEGKCYEMVGIFKGESQMTTSLKRFGYCQGEALEATILSEQGGVLRGHEFHHSEFHTAEKAAYVMRKERGGESWLGGYSKGNTLASYLHIHFYSQLQAVERFLSQGRED